MATYEKNYTPTIWKDKPSTDTSINAYRLNKLENGVNTNDNRLVALSQDKLEVSEANQMVQNVTLDTKAGVMTVILKNGTRTTYDLDIEKVVSNFDLDEDNNLVLTLENGTRKTVSLSSLVDTYTFTDSETISFNATGKNITAIIPDGAVTLPKLEATVISTIRKHTLDAQTAKGQAEQAAATAQGYAVGGEGFEGVNAKDYSSLSQSWAIGGTGSRHGEDGNNSKYYSDQSKADADRAKNEADRAAQYASIIPPTFHIDFDTMELIQDSQGGGITFTLDENKVLSFEYMA